MKVTTGLAALEATLNAELHGWTCWAIMASNGREWSAMPDGAKSAVITRKASASDLYEAVRAYEHDLPSHLEDARQKLAAVAHNNVGRAEAAVLESLVEALEKLATKDNA